MIVKGKTRRTRKRKKKRKLKRKENGNLLVMAKTGNRQRRKKRKFPDSQREVFHHTSSTSVTIVRRSSRTMLALVSLKLPKFSVHNGRLSVLKKKLHMKSWLLKINSDMLVKWTNSRRMAEKSKPPNRRNLLRRRKRLPLPKALVQQKQKHTSHKKRYPMIHQTKNCSRCI